jgi:hypothetical protein
MKGAVRTAKNWALPGVRKSFDHVLRLTFAKFSEAPVGATTSVAFALMDRLWDSSGRALIDVVQFLAIAMLEDVLSGQWTSETAVNRPFYVAVFGMLKRAVVEGFVELRPVLRRPCPQEASCPSY